MILDHCDHNYLQYHNLSLATEWSLFGQYDDDDLDYVSLINVNQIEIISNCPL